MICVVFYHSLISLNLVKNILYHVCVSQEKFQHGFRMLFKRCVKRYDIDAQLMDMSNAGSGRLSMCSREGSLHITRDLRGGRKDYLSVVREPSRRCQLNTDSKKYVRVSFRQSASQSPTLGGALNCNEL